MSERENLLDYIGYSRKWHGTVQNQRRRVEYSTNEHLISEILNRIGIQQGLCVEFGAWDGLHGSNTKKLIDRGWHSVQIEPEVSRFNLLRQNHEDNSKVFCINKHIDTKENLFDNLVKINKNIDFCSIDIDGHDLDVFETFEKNLPKVVCIEGGQMLMPDHERVTPEVSKNNIQQSLGVFNETFNKRGYKLICTYQDSFFVKEEYYHLFDVSENLLDLYLDGLGALPRFPWIKQKLDENGLSNKIVDEIIEACSYIHPSADLDSKAAWVDENHSTIERTINNFRESVNAGCS